ncbi:MAG: helix-turn-helix domain-containing protein [Eubacterium sp.]|nr:helix-turn-helix domain-containing protein [Eubacterium sp.]
MRLLELRISNKLSQKELGKALDLTQQRISLLE